MDRISAGNNLSIEIQPDRWRLYANGADTERALVEAAPGEPLRYLQAFGSTRRLPDTGVLPTQYIQRVVLGWSNDDEAWHLGFLLGPELASPRGSRWCELVHWPDPDGELFGAVARQAAETLAETMERPYYYVEPRPAQRAKQPTALPPLPHKIDDWGITVNSAGQIEATLTQTGRGGRLLRGIWYIILSMIYFLLSGLTLASGIALPRPEFLPYAGLAAAVLLLILALRAIFFSKQPVDRIVVHPEAKAIRGLARGIDRWRLEADDLEAVYVSQVVHKPRRNGVQAIPYGELNLRTQDGKFQLVLQQSAHELTPDPHMIDHQPAEGVYPLNPPEARTALEALALHTAQMLDRPCFYDRRLK